MTEQLQAQQPKPFTILQDPLDKNDAWLNQTVSLPAIATVEQRIKREILAFCETHRSLPLEVRANPLTVIEMPCSQWTTFRINVQDRLIEVPIIADCKIIQGEVQCVVEQATAALGAINAGVSR